MYHNNGTSIEKKLLSNLLGKIVPNLAIYTLRFNNLLLFPPFFLLRHASNNILLDDRPFPKCLAGEGGVILQNCYYAVATTRA